MQSTSKLSSALTSPSRTTGKATDLWHVGVAHAPIARFLAPMDAAATPITWLPLPRPFAFIADPFAVRDRDGGLTILVEALDYRTKRGAIHYYRLNADDTLRDTGVALRANFHLSYPFLISHAHETYMLPEAHRSGKLTLYRATHFPTAWEPVADLLDLPAIDASPIKYNGTWWMFFALPGDNARALSELHIAYADDLLGPWALHPHNPVRTGLASSRMGGTPFVHAGALYLPMQDCTKTYGGAMNLLRVTELTRDRFAAEEVRHLTPDHIHPDFTNGLHTLSACGEVTLIDVKRTHHSAMRHVIDFQRRIQRLFRVSSTA